MGARHPGDHPGRGVLLRAAAPDEDPERRLGRLLAQQDHDGAGGEGQRDHRLRRPQRQRAGDRARAVQSVQDRHRAAARRGRALGQGALRPRVERLPEPGRAADLGQAPWPGAEEDLRGSQALQRRDLHRRVLHGGLLRAQQVLLVLGERSDRQLRDRLARVREDQTQDVVLADQLRRPLHLRRGLELREPGRAAAAPPPRRHRSADRPRPLDAGRARPHLAPSR